MIIDKLQADAALRGIPVVALSVQGDRPEHRARYLRQGCSAVLAKPFERDELRAVVARAVRAPTGIPSAVYSATSATG